MIGIPRFARVLETGAVLFALTAAAACHRSGRAIGSRPASRDGAGFVGIVSEVRSMRIMAREESAPMKRSAEIWVSPSTEIVSRAGFMVPIETIRRGMRVIVWFTAELRETEHTIEGRASKVVVE